MQGEPMSIQKLVTIKMHALGLFTSLIHLTFSLLKKKTRIFTASNVLTLSNNCYMSVYMYSHLIPKKF